MVAKRNSKAQDILQALALMLESSRGARITTAALAAELGCSEAALYRHFPSKTKMYEGLIDFIEETIFASDNEVLQVILNYEKALAHPEDEKNIRKPLRLWSVLQPGILKHSTNRSFLSFNYQIFMPKLDHFLAGKRKGLHWLMP